MKHPFPFRLGCTSYVYPDDLLPNVEKTAPQFDDIEIVLFESLDATNLPSRAVLQSLKKLGKEHDTTYTIHFPIDKKAGSPDKVEQAAFQEQMKRIMEMTALLEPYGFLLHLESLYDSEEAWSARVRDACLYAKKLAGSESGRICVENLGYPYLWNMPLVRKFGFSCCLDVGHALRYGEDLFEVTRTLLPATRVIHLHGWDGKKDHLSLARTDKKILANFISQHLRTYTGVLTLEVFSENDTFESAEVIKSLWEK